METDIDEDGPDREEVPTKVVVEDTKLIVRAQLLQLDYDGRSDGRSMRLILSKVAPRHLVLMHGSPQVWQAASSDCITVIAFVYPACCLERCAWKCNKVQYMPADMGNSVQATEILRDACAEDLYPVNAQVHCPGNGETVDLSAGTASFQVVPPHPLNSPSTFVLSPACMRIDCLSFLRGW